MKPLIIAHRGASGYAPENTRAAFLKAFKFNIGAVEFDIQETKDKVLVVFHDYGLERITGKKGYVKDYTLTQIKQLNCRFGRQFTKEKILTFSEALKIVGNKKPIFIDIKDKYLDDPKQTAIEIMKKIRQNKITVPVTLAGDKHIIDKFIGKYNLPNVSLQYYHFKLKDPFRKIEKLNYTSINVSCILATNKFIRKAHKHKIKVYSWVLNTKRGMKKQISRGVDGIYTNYPDILLEVENGFNKSSSKRN